MFVYYICEYLCFYNYMITLVIMWMQNRCDHIWRVTCVICLCFVLCLLLFCLLFCCLLFSSFAVYFKFWYSLFSDSVLGGYSCIYLCILTFFADCFYFLFVIFTLCLVPVGFIIILISNHNSWSCCDGDNHQFLVLQIVFVDLSSLVLFCYLLPSVIKFVAALCIQSSQSKLRNRVSNKIIK